MDAEGEREDVLVLDIVDAGRTRGISRRPVHRRAFEGGIELGVDDIEAHVELGGDIPLRAGADIPERPVGIAVAHVDDGAAGHGVRPASRRPP